MANTRIRYINEGNLLISRRVFEINGGKSVQAVLDLENKKFKILDAVSGEVVSEGGNTKNKSVLKLQTKRALVALGAVFDEEARNRNEVAQS